MQFNILGFETKEELLGEEMFSSLKIFFLDNCCMGVNKYLLTSTLYKSQNEFLFVPSILINPMNLTLLVLTIKRKNEKEDRYVLSSAPDWHNQYFLVKEAMKAQFKVI